MSKEVLRPYREFIKVAGFKIQPDGGFTRPYNIRDINVVDAVVILNEEVLKSLDPGLRAKAVNMVKERAVSKLRQKGLDVTGSHTMTHPGPDEAHITLKIVENEALEEIIQSLNPHPQLV